MNISCPICDTSIEVSKFLVGQKGRCPKCASKFIIPESPDDEMEVLEKGEIPADEPDPVPPPPAPEKKSKPAPKPKASEPPKVSTGAAKRVVVPATGGAPARAPARPVVVKQSSGAFGFLFAIVLAALVGVVVYVMMDKQPDKVVAEKPEKKEKAKVEKNPRPLQPVVQVEPDEPEVEGFSVYAKVIQPVLEAKCTSCHGEEKAKGRLAMHSYEKLAAGSGNGSILEPDADDESRVELVFRAELPEDDEEHMPPQGKTQLTAEELDVLKWWIKEGAFEGIESTEAPEEIRKKLEALAKL